MMIFGYLPHTCACTWSCIQTKDGNKRDSTGSRTREPLFELKYFLIFLFYFHGARQVARVERMVVL
jgi:hypothetical protein